MAIGDEELGRGRDHAKHTAVDAPRWLATTSRRMVPVMFALAPPGEAHVAAAMLAVQSLRTMQRRKEW